MNLYSLQTPSHGAESHITPFELRWIKAKLLSDRECGDMLSNEDNPSGFICAKYDKPLHQYKSGGDPLAMHNTIYGISVYGKPYIFINVFKHLKEIQDFIA